MGCPLCTIVSLSPSSRLWIWTSLPARALASTVAIAVGHTLVVLLCADEVWDRLREFSCVWDQSRCADASVVKSPLVAGVGRSGHAALWRLLGTQGRARCLLSDAPLCSIGGGHGRWVDLSAGERGEERNGGDGGTHFECVYRLKDDTMLGRPFHDGFVSFSLLERILLPSHCFGSA